MHLLLVIFNFLIAGILMSCQPKTSGPGDRGEVVLGQICAMFTGTWLRNDLGSGSDTCETRSLPDDGNLLDSQNSTYYITRDTIALSWNKYGRTLTSTTITTDGASNSDCSGEASYSDTINMDIESATRTDGVYLVTATISSLSRTVHSEGGTDSGAYFLNALYQGSTSCDKSDWAEGEYVYNRDFTGCSGDDRKFSHSTSGLSEGQTMYLTFDMSGNTLNIRISTDRDNLGTPGTFEAM